MPLFTGSCAAIVTPFSNDGINFAEFEKHIDFLIDNKTDAIAVLGTTGEPSTMTKPEREAVLECAIKKVNKRIPLFAGSGGNNTAETVSFSRRCEQIGADGLLVVTPYYNKCTQNGVIEHYRAVAQSVHIPLIAYNVPTRTGFNIAPSTALKLASIKNIVALKEASGDIDQVLDVARLLRGKMDLYSGDDSLTVPSMSLGAKGVISVASNVIPLQIHNMAQSCLDGNYEQAAELYFKIAAFIKSLFCEVNPIPCKAALNLLGFNHGTPRLPLTEIEPQNLEKVKTEMLALGLIK